MSDPFCTACGAAESRADPFYYEWRGRRFQIQRCGRCTHQFVFPSVSAEDQVEIYADHYFAAGGDWAVGHFGNVAYADAETQLRREAREILATLPLTAGSILDIGCAGGVFLDEARRVGFTDVAGIELNASMAEQARTRHGITVWHGGIETASLDRESFDVVTLLDCLEHIPAPLAALQKVARWLRPGGVVLIRGPLSNSPTARTKELLRRVTRRVKQLPGYPLDANMFNPRSLAAMLDAAGFDGLEWPMLRADFGTLLARKSRTKRTPLLETVAQSSAA